MPQAVRKAVSIVFGLLSTTVTVYSAVDSNKASGNKQVCTGYGLDDAGKPRSHDVTPIAQPKTCSTCGEVPHYAVQKGRPVDGGWVVFSDEDTVAIAADAVPYQKSVNLTPHPFGAVDELTAVGDKLYHLVPDAGQEGTYALLATFIASHPETAFMGEYAPRSAIGQYRVLVRDGVIMLQQRIRTEKVRSAPVFDKPEVPAQNLAMADMFLSMDGVVTEYDPETYRDKAAEKVAAIVATKDVLAGVATTDAPAAVATTGGTVADNMAALTAMLAQHGAIPAETPAKKGKKKAA